RTFDPNNKDADGIRAGVKARNGQIVLAGAEACARDLGRKQQWDKWARGCSELEFVQIARVELELGKAYCDPVFTIAGLSIILREPRTILAFGSGCSARAEVSPRSGDRFDAWPASARSFARCHTESTRERTQAGAAAIRSS